MPSPTRALGPNNAELCASFFGSDKLYAASIVGIELDCAGPQVQNQTHVDHYAISVYFDDGTMQWITVDAATRFALLLKFNMPVTQQDYVHAIAQRLLWKSAILFSCLSVNDILQFAWAQYHHFRPPNVRMVSEKEKHAFLQLPPVDKIKQCILGSSAASEAASASDVAVELEFRNHHTTYWDYFVKYTTSEGRAVVVGPFVMSDKA
jgi:hypothetical protein